MLNINLKSRLRNKAFWVALVSTIVLLTQQLGYKVFPNNWADILNSVLSIFILLGIVVDTSTTGISDKTNSIETILNDEGNSENSAVANKEELKANEELRTIVNENQSVVSSNIEDTLN